MKEKKTKRGLTALTAVLLILLVSCGTAANDQTTKAVAAKDETQKAEAKEEVTIQERAIQEVATEKEERDAAAAEESDVYFVDKEGTILCVPVAGADDDRYQATLDALLSGNAVTDPAADSTANAITGSQDIQYTVCVTDENGPAAGVTIQFCSDTCCMMGKTDANGQVSFTMPTGEIYDVHVLRVPEGYEKDDTVYHTANESNEVQIQLKKKQ